MLDSTIVARLDQMLAADDEQRARRYPATVPEQPVHTVYVPADRYGESTVADWRSAAVDALNRYGPLPGVDSSLHARVLAKLASEPIEDLRIDFEDGYGVRDDAEEDAAARAAAMALCRTPTRFCGLRIKSLEPATRRRAVRTLDLFLGELRSHGRLPEGFRVTLPKVTSVEQIEAMVELCKALEAAHAMPGLRFEIQVETPQAMLGPDGAVLVARMIHAADGRCAGLHYGTYDYSAALGIAAEYQSMEHPAADHAKAVLQVAAAGTGTPISDGSTNVLPVGDAAAVRSAWQLHLRLVRRSLERGLYQGWDLHPAQLPTRYAATFAFYRDGASVAATRLRAYLGRVDSGVLDEPATARALASYLLRGLGCGAVDGAEVSSATGLDVAMLESLARSGTS